MTRDPLDNYARQLSEVIHDLRTPLTSIIGAASSLKDYGGRFSEETRSLLCDGIMEQAEHLGQMLTGISITAKAKSGALTQQATRVDLEELLRDTLQKAQSQHGEARVGCADIVPSVTVQSDPQLLQTAILCLVEAAAHHVADDRTIELAVSQDDGLAWIAIITGIRPTAKAAAGALIDFLAPPDTPPNTLNMALVSLAAAKEAIQTLGGKLIAALDEANSQLSFRVGLPH